MNFLPIEIVLIISNNIEECRDIISMKNLCKEYNENIPRFSILKRKVKTIFNNPKTLNSCVNINCYDETEDLYTDLYREYSGRYIHCHQQSVNFDTIYINKKCYKIFTPYCCECFKKYILIGDKSMDKVKNILIEDFVDIDYLDARDV